MSVESTPAEVNKDDLLDPAIYRNTSLPYPWNPLDPTPRIDPNNTTTRIDHTRVDPFDSSQLDRFQTESFPASYTDGQAKQEIKTEAGEDEKPSRLTAPTAVILDPRCFEYSSSYPESITCITASRGADALQVHDTVINKLIQTSIVTTENNNVGFSNRNSSSLPSPQRLPTHGQSPQFVQVDSSGSVHAAALVLTAAGPTTLDQLHAQGVVINPNAAGLMLSTGLKADMFHKVPLGEKGRMELKAAIRTAIKQRPELREKVNQVAKLRCATIPQLLKIASICDLWNMALNISRRFMESRNGKQGRQSRASTAGTASADVASRSKIRKPTSSVGSPTSGMLRVVSGMASPAGSVETASTTASLSPASGSVDGVGRSPLNMSPSIRPTNCWTSPADQPWADQMVSQPQQARNHEESLQHNRAAPSDQYSGTFYNAPVAPEETFASSSSDISKYREFTNNSSNQSQPGPQYDYTEGFYNANSTTQWQNEPNFAYEAPNYPSSDNMEAAAFSFGDFSNPTGDEYCGGAGDVFSGGFFGSAGSSSLMMDEFV